MMSWLCCPDEDAECEQREWSAPSSRWWFLTKNTKNDLKTKIWQCLVLSLADLGIQTRVELISFSSSWLKFSHLNHWTLTSNIIILNQKLFFFSFWKWQNVCLLVLIWFDSLIHCWPGSVWKCWLISELLSGKHHSTSQKLIPRHNFKHWQHFSF